MHRYFLGLFFGMIGYCSVVAATQHSQFNLNNLQLKDLAELTITEVSKRHEKIYQTPAAVSLLSNQDIVDSGALQVVELLRYIPGLEVSQINSGQWAVSIRGFNERSANKLLVMVDGRSIYSSLFSGTLWEEKNILVEDIQQIEVIRGPGGALWGANAMNGVINIITKSAIDTRSTLLRTSTSNQTQHQSVVRHGWGNSEQASRIYAGYERHNGVMVDDEKDEGAKQYIGFRSDFNIDENTELLTLSGAAYKGWQGSKRYSDSRLGQNHWGYNFDIKYQQNFEDDKSRTWFGYFDQASTEANVIGDRRTSVFISVEQSQNIWDTDVVWGASFQQINDQTRNGQIFSLSPASDSNRVYSVFFNDRIQFNSIPLQWSFGLKLEKHPHFGLESQPSSSLSWSPEHGFYWLKLNRAIRVPSRLEHDLVIGEFNRDNNLDSEVAEVLELGYRKLFSNQLSLDLTAYSGHYTRLRTIGIDALTNHSTAKNRGFDVELKWVFNAQSTLVVFYNYLDMDVDYDQSKVVLDDPNQIEGSSPKHKLNIQPSWQLAPDKRLSLALRYRSELPHFDLSSRLVADINYQWNLNQNLNLSFAAHNLFEGSHYEWGTTNAHPISPRYSIIIKANW
jgi:iron complex outermembrane recepter protein